MRATVRKWGNSAALRLPAQVMEAARLSVDQPVEIREEAGRIVIEPIREVVPDLAALIAAITDENRHDGVEFGPPRGAEAW
jgi:antitoxin MazE